MSGRREHTRESIRQTRKNCRLARAELRRRQRIKGLKPVSRSTLSNSLSPYRTVDEERRARETAVTGTVQIIRGKLPVLMRRMKQIDDPRNPRKLKHALASLLLYGMLGFVFQMASRRQANREMSRPVFKENLLLLFPELREIPHHDTLGRVLERIDVEEIQQAQLELLGKLLHKQKFRKYLVQGCYPVAIDGTQKFSSTTLWDAEYLERRVDDKAAPTSRYYLYVLESYLAFPGGMSIPFLTEFLDYHRGDSGREKQDCELRAFYRLVSRIKEAFPRLPFMLLIDGLYSCGPVIERCRANGWQYMIVLQDDSLSNVWIEYRGLLTFLNEEDQLEQNWGCRRQRFHWVNHIDYAYRSCKGTRRLKLHLVVCEESWEEVDPTNAQTVTKTSRHVWLSSAPLRRGNVHERCNLAARNRWTVESGILVEKSRGYHYEHCFAYSWTAMKGYHYLMHLAHLFTVLAHHACELAPLVRRLGGSGFAEFLRSTLAGPWLDHQRVTDRLSHAPRLRLSGGT